MDSVDLKIVGLLMKDAQAPFSAIAQQLGIGTDTVIRRYRRLKEEGVIYNASIIVDLKKCSYNYHVFFSVNVLPGTDTNRLYEKLIRIPNVLTVATTIGDYDFMLHCVYANLPDLMRLNKEIAETNGIKYIDLVSLPAKNFIPTFPTITYYSKAILNEKAKHNKNP
ncbi:MAG: Lrp/AsnC family transcriptional regulator [Candidatus Bathyarchaeia archaeon]|jgi:DNA-binding Lrp family transcriptional regulator